MTKQVQIRRGTDSQHTSFTGAEGEISVNTTNDSVHVHDGTTAGGKELARADGSNVAFTSGTIDGTIIGGTTPAAGTFTTLTASGDLTVDTNTLFVDASANAVGIGNTVIDSNAKLDVSGGKIYADNLLLNDGASSSLNNRLGCPSANTIGIFTNDTRALTIDSSQRVGIGQSVPAGQLHLTSSDITDQVIIENTDTSAAAAPDLVLWKNSSSPADNDALGQVFFRGENSSGTATNYAAIDAVSADVTAGTEDGKLRFQTRAAGSIADRLVIDGQNVGIGTSSPLTHSNGQAVLTVGDGSIQGQPYIKLDRDSTGGYWAGIEFMDEGSVGGAIHEDADKNMRFHTNGSERMRIDSSGNVGIGATPTTKFQIGESTGRTFTINQDTANLTQLINDRGISLQSGLGYGTSIKALGGAGFGNITFETSSNGEVARIASDASVLVGTTDTSPTSTSEGLQFYKNTGEKTGRINFYQNSSNSSATRIAFFRGTSAIGSITTSSASTAYNTTSDYRLKENVTDITDGIERVKQLNPSRFNFIADADTTVDGFLAHEVSDIVPEAITGEKDAMQDEEYEVTPAVYEDVVIPAVLDDDGNEIEAERTEQQLVTEAVMGTRSVPDYQGIDQSKLVPLLTAALQEAIAKIETLEAKVTALENA